MYLQTSCTLLFYYIETKMGFWKFCSKCVMEQHPSSHVLLFWSFFLGHSRYAILKQALWKAS